MTLTTNRTGAHRKNELGITRAVKIRHYAAGAMLLALAVALLALLFSVTAQQASASTINWTHVLHVLTVAYQYIHGNRALFRFYLHHHALAFLRSGVTSGSGGKGYLWWLTSHHVAPVDW